MELQVIQSEEEYHIMLNWVDEQFDKKVLPDSVQGKQLQIALLLITQYEDHHYQIQ